MDCDCGHQGYVHRYWRACYGTVLGGAGRDAEVRRRAATRPCKGAGAELTGRLRPSSGEVISAVTMVDATSAVILRCKLWLFVS